MTVTQDAPPLAPITEASRGELCERVYESLRDAILRGALPPGTRIIEEALAQQLQVSRAPLRQALLLLKGEGLLVDESARTTRVVSLDLESIRELHMLRVLLESVACQHAAIHITSQEIAEIETILGEMQAASEDGDRQAVARLDYAFHQAVCAASRLPRLVEMWERQHVLVRLWLNMVGDTLSEHHDHIAARHQQILDAVLEGDPDAIFNEVLSHVYFVGGALQTERRRWAAQQPRVTSPSPIRLDPSTVDASR